MIVSTQWYNCSCKNIFSKVIYIYIYINEDIVQV